MIGDLYSVSASSNSMTTAKTLIELLAPSDAVLFVERVWIKQTSFDTSENLGTTTQRVSTTGTGTAQTPVPYMFGTTASATSVEIDATAEPIYTSNEELLEDGFNVLSGYLWTPANDDEIIVITPAKLLGTNLDIAPSTSMNFSYGCTIREIGG